MDWSKGASGQYPKAAANTELVGRQLGFLLLKMIRNGLDPSGIHLIGFSLGAHIAACASEVLKQRGILIARITGLDAAGPLFRTNHLREKHKKLDKDDAQFVDAVHTDSSPYITDGFGLWKPIGHVDFFPNGGQEQPGCSDPKQSVLASHDSSLNRDFACSHIRAWHFFEETLLNKVADTNRSSNNNAERRITGLQSQCEFVAFACPGGHQSFSRGHCFPQLMTNTNVDIDYRNEIGRFGEDANGEGVMYFVTRDTSPYCGTQLQASVHLSPQTGPVNGIIAMRLQYGNFTLDFKIKCKVIDFMMTGSVLSGLNTAVFHSLDSVKQINATLRFTSLEYDEENNAYTPPIYVDRIVVKNMTGYSWQFCHRGTQIKENATANFTLVDKPVC